MDIKNGSTLEDTVALFDDANLIHELSEGDSITQQLDYIHQITRARFPFVDRVAVALYDANTDLLKTFAHSTDLGNPLPLYQARLSEARSLNRIREQRKPRVVNDLSVFDRSPHVHAKRIRGHGYLSSYTVPLYRDGEFVGFVFFNSREKNVFVVENLSYLAMIARLIALLVGSELSSVRTLHGALKTATLFSHHRDPETGAHLERMACFSRQIARAVARERGLSDEYVENVFWFAPLHDVGKIAIPDTILLKPGRLSAEEYEVMKEHAVKGDEILANMLTNFRIDKQRNAAMLRNIARHHHENVDGSGYPDGLAGEAIPLEARIVAVADVFDALTSERPYKRRWSNDEAFAELRRLSGRKLEPGLVAALEYQRDMVEEAQRRFRDEPSPEL